MATKHRRRQRMESTIMKDVDGVLEEIDFTATFDNGGCCGPGDCGPRD